jgi:hypothetical protein
VLGSELLDHFVCCVGDGKRLQAAGSLAIIAGMQEEMFAAATRRSDDVGLRRAGGAVNVSGDVR